MLDVYKNNYITNQKNEQGKRGGIMQPKTLGRRLRRLRKINGETQREFAENFGRHHRTVQNWELDLSVPDVFTAMALAEYYNMTVEELVNGEDDYDKEF